MASASGVRFHTPASLWETPRDICNLSYRGNPMPSRRSSTMRARCASAVLVASLGALGAFATSAQAMPIEDGAGPILTSKTITPGPYRPGDTITVSYTATDASPIVKVTFSFSHVRRDGSFAVVEEAAAVSGRATLKVPATWWSGDYGLSAVELVDSLGNKSTYGNGSSDYVTIAGTSLDGDPPRLTSLTRTRTPQYADEYADYSYTATDEALPLERVDLNYTNPASTGTYTSWNVPAPASGVLRVGAGLPGPTSITSFTLTDTHGNEARYWADGRVDGFRKPPLQVDFAALGLTLRPGRPSARLRPVPRAAHLTVCDGVAQDNAVDGYRVTVTPGGRVIDLPAGTLDEVRGCVRRDLAISGLTNGVTYTVSVVARSQWGDGRPFVRAVTPMPSTNILSPGDVDRDGRADIVALLEKGAPVGGDGLVTTPVYLYPGTGTGSVRTRSLLSRQLDFNRIAPAGRASGVRTGYYADSETYQRLERYGTSGSPTVVSIGSQWKTMRFIDGGADFSGDGNPDILVVPPTGELYRYRLSSTGGIVDKKQIGSGWQYFLAVFSPGDFNGDRKADVVAVDTAGRMWLYRGNGVGGWYARVQIGSGWQWFGAVLPLRDFNGDGRVDIGAVKMTGELLLYPGNGRGGFSGSPKQIGSGWNQFF